MEGIDQNPERENSGEHNGNSQNQNSDVVRKNVVRPYNKRSDKDYPASEGGFNKKKPYFGKRVSYFVKNPSAPIDYKRVDILVKFISNKGKIVPRKFTGLSALHQRRIAKAIKRARHAGLLPYSYR